MTRRDRAKTTQFHAVGVEQDAAYHAWQQLARKCVRDEHDSRLAIDRCRHGQRVQRQSHKRAADLDIDARAGYLQVVAAGTVGDKLAANRFGEEVGPHGQSAVGVRHDRNETTPIAHQHRQ